MANHDNYCVDCGNNQMALDCIEEMCSVCCDNSSCPRHGDGDESSGGESESSDSCPDCGYDLEDYVSLDEHRTEDEGVCDHIRTTTSGDREICFCCGKDLGYWQTNEEFYDTIGAPYDDYNP